MLWFFLLVVGDRNFYRPNTSYVGSTEKPWRFLWYHFGDRDWPSYGNLTRNYFAGYIYKNILFFSCKKKFLFSVQSGNTESRLTSHTIKWRSVSLALFLDVCLWCSERQFSLYSWAVKVCTRGLGFILFMFLENSNSLVKRFTVHRKKSHQLFVFQLNMFMAFISREETDATKT